MKIWSLLLTVLIFSSASAAEKGYRIKYISGESVYLDAGTADSLAVGDRLKIVTGNSVSAELEIVFAAENSSSCKILSQTIPPKVGDMAILGMRGPEAAGRDCGQPSG